MPFPRRESVSRLSQPKQFSWQVLRPFAFALGLLVFSDGLMYLGDHYLVHEGFPWALVSLLVLGAVASLWGLRAAALALLLTAFFGDVIVPDQHISFFSEVHFSLSIRLIRTFLFMLCGGTLIVVVWQARVMRERAALRREVLQAMQRMVLPETLPAIPGCDLASLYFPARQEEEVGGDFFDVFPVDAAQEVFGILIGDVVGKGKEAAEHTALLRYTARAYAGLNTGPADVLRRLNALLESQASLMGSASMFVGIYHAATGVLHYANAGHEPPLLARADGALELLSSTGTLVGILADAPYTQVETQLLPGDSLLLVTDGVTEARNAQGQFLDEAGAWRLLHPSLMAPSATRVVAQFYQRLEAFMDGYQRDDIAVLFLRRTFVPAETSHPRPLAGTTALSTLH